jgi:L-fuconolactonase
MLRIDAHQHFWRYEPVRDSWINDDMQVIRRDFLPLDLEPVLARNHITGSVVVQSDQSPAENEFLLQHAAANDFIRGVVGWIDLQADNVEEQLQELSRHKKLKGFRHVLQAEPDPAFMLRPQFMKGISHLSTHHFTYDILIYPRHLLYAKQLAEAFPDQPFVIDHMAKPAIKDRLIDEWKKDIWSVAQLDNVSCKISGMVTEADWQQWKKEDFRPYLDVAFEVFGPKRILFGSDWPVCLVAASYEKMLEIVEDYIGEFTLEEQQDFWAGNATSFYNLT